MASRPAVKTKLVTRDKLASFLPNHELIRAFENLTHDVAHVLPDAAQTSSTSSDAAQETADDALASAGAAQASANAAQNSANDALDQLAGLEGLLPAGGDAGHVPTKNSATSFDYAWAALPFPPFLYAQSTAAQGPGFDVDTSLTGSAIGVGIRLKQGSRYRCVFDVNKTAAGVAAPVVTVRVGTAGTTADAAVSVLTFPAQTAVADEGIVEVFVTARSVGVAGVIHAVATMTHRFDAAGFSTDSAPAVRTTSAGFDTTVAGSIISLSVNAGSAAAWTVSLVHAEATNLT